MSQQLSCDEIRELAAPFVLGALEDDEMEAVRTHLAECPDAHAEFLELGSVVPALAETLDPVEPSAAVRDRIMAAAAAELSQRTTGSAVTGPSDSIYAAGTGPTAAPEGAAAPAGATTVPPAPPALVRPTAPTPFPSAAERARREERRAMSAMPWVLRAAAVLAIVALGGWNLLLQGRLDASETYNRDVAAVLDVAARPGALTAVLVPQTPGGPRGLAALDPDGFLTLAVRDLGPTSGSQVYEAWAIVGEAAPVALGGFTVGATGTGRFDGSGVPAQAGLAVALTLEPAPGASAPSTAPIVVGTMTGLPSAEGGRSTDLAQAGAASGG